MIGPRGFPLFWRIFLLIWLAMVVTVLAANFATRELVERERSSIEREKGLRDVGQQAVTIRETQGLRAARRYLREQGRELSLFIALLERGQRGDSLPPEIRERMKEGWLRHRPVVLHLPGHYRLVAWPREGGEGWLDPRWFRWLQMAIGFVVITLACWWLARILAKPLRHMEHTARQIADGDISLRVSERISRRRDEVGAMATAFNDMTDRLCQLLERQKHLLRDISHDLRTPLSRQRVAIELACDSGADVELMDSIRRQNERLEAMTAQILSLYQVQDQRWSMPRSPVEPVRVMQTVLRDAADYAEHQRVDCHLDVADGVRDMLVLGDADWLQRAFENVLQNALDHTPPSGVVSVLITATAESMTVRVQDQGPGVEAGALAHLFEPFYRTDQARSGQGWGLGLAIARDIIAVHDGSVSAENLAQGGLEIRIQLPLFSDGVEPL